MWNFSNGDNLLDLEFHEGPPKNSKTAEITQLICFYDPDDKDGADDAHCIGVGWDKRIYDWSLNQD